MSIFGIVNNFSYEVLSSAVIDSSVQFGKIEEIIQQKGFPRCPIAPKVDTGEIALDHFKERGEELCYIRDKIEVVFQRLNLLSSSCDLVLEDTVREIFKRQIQLLHEKRAFLENPLRNLQWLLKSHLILDAAASSLEDIQKEIARDDLQADYIEIRKRIKAIEIQVKTVFPIVKGDGLEFCNLHWKRKEKLFRAIMILETKLNIKENKKRESIRSVINQLLNEFKALSQSVEQSVVQLKIKENIYKTLQSLPIELLEEIYNQVSPLQKDVLTNIGNFTIQSNLNYVEQALENLLQKYPIYCPSNMSVLPRQISKKAVADDGTFSEKAMNIQLDEKQYTAITVKHKDELRDKKISIRGNGPGLSWEEGIPLVQIDEETWELKIANVKDAFAYKIVINDEWEQGENRKIVPGKKEIIQLALSSIPLLFQKTVIEIEYKVPEGKLLYMSGNGPLGNWDKKVQLSALGNDRWHVSFDGQWPKFEYKFLLNEKWEQVNNRVAESGKKYHFSSLTF